MYQHDIIHKPKKIYITTNVYFFKTISWKTPLHFAKLSTVGVDVVSKCVEMF